MIKKIAWNTFKNTGNIDTFLEFKQIDLIENQIKQNQEILTTEFKQIQDKIKGE